ncbi:ribonuclease H-like domain-containing protein [Tanacetum coccineum]
MNTKLSCDSALELSKQDLIDQLNLLYFFDVQTPKSPYDEGRATPSDEGNALNTPNNLRNVSEGRTATFMGDKSISEPVIATRKSNRQTKLPAKFNDYVVNSNTMNAKIKALNKNNTWSIIDLPKGRKPIGSKWISKIKYKASGETERYKARLVAKGCSKKEGIHYDETFSLVVTVRCLVSIDVQKDWPLFQLDVNNVFLYGDLCEDVYMTLPLGFSANNDNMC